MLKNDGTGDIKEGNYDIRIMINGVYIWSGRVEGHDRSAGWRKLIADLSKVVWDEDTESAHEVWY